MPNPATPETLPTLLTVDEAADRIGIPRNTFRQYAYTRQVPTVKLGRRVYIDAAALAEWLNNGARPAVGECAQ